MTDGLPIILELSDGPLGSPGGGGGDALDLGEVTIDLSPLYVEVEGYAYGTVGNPVYVTQSGSTDVDLATAVLRPTDPPIVTGDGNAGSVWLSFSVDDDYLCTLELSDDAPAEMEVYVGPNYAYSGMNLRLVGWTSPGNALDLGAITYALTPSVTADLTPVAPDPETP